jgi:glucose-6-phosphate isomerase
MGAILETLLVAKIWRVNPFDQPAVESGKKLALHYLNAGNAKV